MTRPRLLRRTAAIFFSLTMSMALQAQSAAEPARGSLQLEAVPGQVYKVADPGRGGTESWAFTVNVSDTERRNGIRPVRAEIEILNSGRVIETRVLGDSALALLRATSFTVLPETHPLSLRRLYHRPQAFDLRLDFPARPQSWGSDAVRLRLTLDVPGGGRVLRTLDVPVREYAQRTALRFPLASGAILTQGPFNNAGHSGFTNQFAIDVMGLGATYGPMGGTGRGNMEFAGFGMPVIAPAAGRVLYVRNDVPDNEPGQDAETVYGAQREPLLATAGNAVIIAHGSGEFSVLMHMQRGSVTVAVGDSVSAGQQVGRIGNSGDSFQPHLHYQLQDGPDLFRAATLPVVFSNVPRRPLARGEYVTPSP